MNSEIKTIAFSLGWHIGRIRIQDKCPKIVLEIVSPSDYDEYGYRPAESIRLCEDAAKILFVSLKEAFKFEEK